MQTIKDFWEDIDFKAKVGIVISTFTSIAVLACLFIFPIFGLVTLFMALCALIIMSLIWAYEAFDHYWYYSRKRR